MDAESYNRRSLVRQNRKEGADLGTAARNSETENAEDGRQTDTRVCTFADEGVQSGKALPQEPHTDVKDTAWDMAVEQLMLRKIKVARTVDEDENQGGKGLGTDDNESNVRSGGRYKQIASRLSGEVDDERLANFISGGWDARHRESAQRLAEETAQLEEKVNSERKKRLMLEMSLLGAGLELPNLEKEEQAREVNQLESSVTWLKRELQALRVHLQLLQIQWIDKMRADTTSAAMLAKHTEELLTLQTHLQGQLEWTLSTMELERQMNNQLEEMLDDDDVDLAALAAFLESSDKVKSGPTSPSMVTTWDESRSGTPRNRSTASSPTRGNPRDKSQASSPTRGSFRTKSMASSPTRPGNARLDKYSLVAPDRTPPPQALVRVDTGSSEGGTSERSWSDKLRSRRASPKMDLQNGRSGKHWPVEPRDLGQLGDLGDRMGGGDAREKAPEKAGKHHRRGMLDIMSGKSGKWDRSKADKELQNIVKERENDKELGRSAKDRLKSKGESGGSGNLAERSGRLGLFDKRRKSSKSSMTLSVTTHLAADLEPRVATRSAAEMRGRPNELSEELLRCMLFIYRRHALAVGGTPSTSATPSNLSSPKSLNLDTPHWEAATSATTSAPPSAPTTPHWALLDDSSLSPNFSLQAAPLHRWKTPQFKTPKSGISQTPPQTPPRDPVPFPHLKPVGGGTGARTTTPWSARKSMQLSVNSQQTTSPDMSPQGSPRQHRERRPSFDADQEMRAALQANAGLGQPQNLSQSQLGKGSRVAGWVANEANILRTGRTSLEPEWRTSGLARTSSSTEELPAVIPTLRSMPTFNMGVPERDMDKVSEADRAFLSARSYGTGFEQSERHLSSQLSIERKLANRGGASQEGRLELGVGLSARTPLSLATQVSLDSSFSMESSPMHSRRPSEGMAGGNLSFSEVELALEEISGRNTARPWTGGSKKGGEQEEIESGPGSRRSMSSGTHQQRIGSNEGLEEEEGFLAEELPPLEWTSLEFSSQDPYGILGDHPCPDPGEYASFLELTSVPVEELRTRSDANLLSRFRMLTVQLEDVDPAKLNHEEKLGFWINLYNALLMHAYLVNGVPSNHMKRISLMSKAAFIVGGHPFSALSIEHSVLRVCSHRPSLTKLLPVHRFKGNDERTAWVLARPEPLVSFALCSGTRSSPSLRIYTASRIREELDIAKEDFLRAAVGISRNGVIILPKVLDWYGRDFASNPIGLLEWVAKQLPFDQRLAIVQRINKSNPTSCMAVVPYDWSFRYLLDSKQPPE